MEGSASSHFGHKSRMTYFFPASQPATLWFYRGQVSCQIITSGGETAVQLPVFVFFKSVFTLVFNNCTHALSQRSDNSWPFKKPELLWKTLENRPPNILKKLHIHKCSDEECLQLPSPPAREHDCSPKKVP